MLLEPTLNRTGNKVACLTILRHFKDMPSAKWSDHDEETFFPGVQHPDCPRCIGLHAAEAMGITQKSGFAGSPFYAFQDGANAIYRAMGKAKDEGNAALHRHGAPPYPFGPDVWPLHPFDVLKPAFEEALGETLDI